MQLPTPRAEAAALEAAQDFHDDLATYDGDEYLAKTWLEDGESLDTTIGIVTDPVYLGNFLDIGRLKGLTAILLDRYAARALGRELARGNEFILGLLCQALTPRKTRAKPGPRPQEDGLFLYERVYRLRQRCLTFGDIAREIWHDPSKRSLATAHYHRAMTHGLPRINCSDGEDE